MAKPYLPLILAALLTVLVSCSNDSSFSDPKTTLKPLGTAYKGAGFIEHLPENYGLFPSPLIIFLHGLGENGSGSNKDLEKVSVRGIPMLIANGQWPSSRPFVVLSFQQQSGCPTADQIHNHIQFALSNYSIDRSRIYLTGLSCGAHGIDDYLAKYGDREVAAVVPIAGSISEAWTVQGCSLVNRVAIWSFFGDQDGASGYSANSVAMQKFSECANRKDVQYTVYPGVGHDSWTNTYDLSAGHDIYDWMLRQSR